jgi:hypothetical protein
MMRTTGVCRSPAAGPARTDHIQTSGGEDMKYRNLSLVFVLLALTLAVMTACGGAASQPVTLNDVPTYANSKLLQPGENPMADSLAKNVEQAAGVGQKLDQRIYTLPSDATWDQVNSFYTGKLGGTGWQSISLPAAAAANPMMQLSIWKRGTQSLTVARLTDPTSSNTFLIFSLSTQ